MANRMTYEMVIRKAHGVGRFGVPGANADTYDSFEMRQMRLNSTEPTNEELFEIGCYTGRICAYLQVAIEKIIADNDDKLTERQKEILEECAENLINFNRESIDDAIDKTYDVLLKLGAE